MDRPDTFPGPGSVARTQRCLERIHAHDAGIRSVVTMDEAGALEAARKADEATARGEWQGLLHGVPMLVKDNIDTAGLRTTYASRFFEAHVPNHDAPVVRRLRAAGAVLLGKATLHEFAFGIRSFNPVTGQCRNPWDRSRVPGGSSGGSGAALAADLCEMALGSDTGGSVRLPSSFNGVSGLRPTVGRVPNAGSMPVSASQDTIGPMARRVSDVARLFSVIAGPDADDPSSVDMPLENFLPRLGDGVRGVRIGIPRNHYFVGAHVEIEAAVREALRVLESLGAVLVEVDVPGAEEMHHYATVVIFSDACAVHRERLASEPERFDAQVLARMSTGLDYTGADYADAMRERAAWRHRLGRLFAGIDLLASPTVHTPVPPIEEDRSLLEATRDATRNTYAGAFGQIPGLSVPCGFGSDGLPIGLQLETRWWREPLLLQAGHAYQQHTDWHLRRPALPPAS
jgi:aspartyl-tRNA(Asn)/glutamyl-tRNA(Gln) amidotransferase subunit A